MNENLKQAAIRLHTAKNELVLAAILLGKEGGFDATIKEIKETVGDISIAIRLIKQE